ncbi:VOC family protein [Stappia sp.]|jgi:hypothetical protein|uniref:VOC family protein n=1 Tax=Stappia sp. TaxID=1870903 RepID=UPI003A9A1923
MRARGLDHLVWPVRDLDAAASRLERVGFTVTPRARHPWGTENRLVQLDGFFIELLSVGEGAMIPETSERVFSFGAFNRDFLAHGEGGSMIVLESGDPQADRDDFLRAGLKVFEPFSFGRTQELETGEKREVGFDLTFVENPFDAELGYFTCRNRFPASFWSRAYMTHANGAQGLASLVLTCDEPASQHEFLSAFTGVREMRATSLGLSVETPRGEIRVLTPAAYAALFGDSAPAPKDGLRIAALVIEGADRRALGERLADQGIAHGETPEGLRIPASDGNGVALVFV